MTCSLQNCDADEENRNKLDACGLTVSLSDAKATLDGWLATSPMQIPEALKAGIRAMLAVATAAANKNKEGG